LLDEVFFNESLEVGLVYLSAIGVDLVQVELEADGECLEHLLLVVVLSVDLDGALAHLNGPLVVAHVLLHSVLGVGGLVLVVEMPGSVAGVLHETHD
jgi:hypothetical protein